MIKAHSIGLCFNLLLLFNDIILDNAYRLFRENNGKNSFGLQVLKREQTLFFWQRLCGPQNFGCLYIIDIWGQPLDARFALQVLLEHIDSSHLHLDTWEQTLIYLSLSFLSMPVVVRLNWAHTQLDHKYLKLQYQEI